MGNEIWIKSQFEEINLEDKGLNKRAQIITLNMMANPSCSLLEQNVNWRDAKGAYRFFDSKLVCFEEIIKPHIELTKTEKK